MFSRRTTSLVMLGHLFAAVEHHDQFWASGHELFTEKMACSASGSRRADP